MKTAVKILVVASVVAAIGGASYLTWKWRGQNTTDAAQVETETEMPEAFPDETTHLLASELAKRIAEYNAQQLAACGNSESVSECQGASQLEQVQDSSKDTAYVFLQKRTIETAHCCNFGIDGGVDSFTTYVFKKGESLEKVTELEGDVYPLADDKFLLSIGASDSCAGRMQDGKVRLYSVAKGESVFEYDLADGFLEQSLEDQSEADVAIQFTVSSEESIQTDPDTPGNPVDDVTRVLNLHCDSTGEHCKVTTVSEDRNRGEQHIGNCD
jgi:hypothetical protein